MSQQQGYYQQGPPQQQGYYQQGPPQQGYYQQGPPQQQPVYVQQGPAKEEGSCMDSCLKCLCCCFLLELLCDN